MARSRRSIEPAAVRGQVRKIGRTTGVTRGRISAFEVDGLPVGYGTGVFTFDDQVEVEGVLGLFSAGGDSGSLITTEGDPLGVGLLFAGSTTGGPGGTGVTTRIRSAPSSTRSARPSSAPCRTPKIHQPRTDPMPDALDRARQVKDNLRASHGTDSRVRGIGVAPRADGFAVRVLVADAAAATDLGCRPSSTACRSMSS